LGVKSWSKSSPDLPNSNAPVARAVPVAHALHRVEGSLLCRRRPAGIGDAPDRAAAVLGNEQGAVAGAGHADRPSPHRTVVDDKAGDEILVFAGRRATLHDHANDFVAGALGSIPRTMLGGKDTAPIVRRKLRSVVDRHAERGRMRFNQNVGQRYLVLKVGALAAVMRIFIPADVIPRPAEEGAFAHPRDVIGRQVVAEVVALVGRAP